MSWILLASVLTIAVANGANDNFKGVATLFGSGTTNYRRALAWATVTTAAGSLSSLLLAGTLLARFTGKGLVPDFLTSSPAFLAAVGGGAAITVLVASRLGAPVSTTHALLGGLMGAGFLASAGDLRLSALARSFVAPLLLSPLLAISVVAVAYPLLRRARRRFPVNADVCVCRVETGLAVQGGASASIQTSIVSIPVLAPARDCDARGFEAALTLPPPMDIAHYLSAGAVGFARGVNDTPKLVALLLPLQTSRLGWGAPAVAAAMAMGGLLGARRVARILSHRIASMTPSQGFTANLVTSGLVIVASRFGLPVSTTHVSSGSLFGLGAVTRGARWQVIGLIALAWIVTIPLAAVCSSLLWLLLRGGS